MNWDAVGALAEVAGAAGVLITLAYLAIQIRQNSASVDASTEDGVTSGFNDINMVIASDAELARIFTAGLDDPNNLTDREAVQFSFIFSSFVNQYNRLLVLYKKRSFREKRWGTHAKELVDLLATHGGALWKSGNPYFSELWACVAALEPESGVDMTMRRAGRDDT